MLVVTVIPLVSVVQANALAKPETVSWSLGEKTKDRPGYVSALLSAQWLIAHKPYFRLYA